MFHNEVHSHKDKIDPSEIKKKAEPVTSKPMMLKPVKLNKKKDIRQKSIKLDNGSVKTRKQIYYCKLSSKVVITCKVSTNSNRLLHT